MRQLRPQTLENAVLGDNYLHQVAKILDCVFFFNRGFKMSKSFFDQSISKCSAFCVMDGGLQLVFVVVE